MRAPETFIRAESGESDGSDGRVNLWSDSVGATAKQLGFVLTLGIVGQLASSLLFGN